MPIANDVRDAGEHLLAAEHLTNEVVNAVLNEFVPTRFRAVAAAAVAADGQSSPVFRTMIVDINRIPGALGETVPSEAMASIIEIYHTITLDNLRSSYERIAQAKAIPKKEPAKEGEFQPITGTFGIILARESTDSLQVLGHEIDRLNKQHHSAVWPDMLVVLSKGTASYAVQFPGEGISSEFLLPTQATSAPIPAYIHLFLRSGGAYALNRMMALLLMALGTVSTGRSKHLMPEVLGATPQTGVTLHAYQFDLSTRLQPVPEEEYVKGRFLAPTPLEIRSREGKVVGHLQYVPWQDGAYLRSFGIPLLPILVMIGKEALYGVRRPEWELSYVLPLRPIGFQAVLERFQRQSNMVVKPPKPPSWTMTKIGSEGTSSPFIARLLAGLLNLRDHVIPEGPTRNNFDKDFEVVNSSLESAREAANEILTGVREHKEKLAAGTIIKTDGRTITLTEGIDRILRKEIETFLNAGVRAIKDGQQRVLNANLGIDIGFLYQKKSKTFEDGVASLRTKHAALADYLAATRPGWSEKFITARNALHGHWTLPRPSYERQGDTLVMTEPEIDRQALSAFVTEMLSHMLLFVEETSAYGLKTLLPGELTFREIPHAERRQEFPERFQIALRTGGDPPWELAYHNKSFEET